MKSKESKGAPATNEAPPVMTSLPHTGDDVVGDSQVVDASSLKVAGKRGGIAFLASFVIHLILLLSLAIWTVGLGGGLGEGGLWIESGEPGGEALTSFEIDSFSMDEAQDDSQGDPVKLSNPQMQREMLDRVADSQDQSTEVQEFGSDQAIAALAASTSGGSQGLGFAETSIAGRSGANKAKLVRENGGNEQSEQAVAWALDYLARHQRNDGSWSMKYAESCDEECGPSSAGKDPYRFAATGLALLCFLGAGHTPDGEQYGEVVSRGIYYLQQTLRMKSDSGYWLDSVASAQMYEHGIATLALCEAYQMTHAAELKEPCQAAVNFIILAQYRDGGWDYHPGSPGDLSIAGWQVLALKSAAATDLIVPGETVRGIDRFIDKTRAGEFMFRYRTNNPTKSMTAIGVLLQIFRGKSKDARSMERGIEYLSKQGPSAVDMYYNYYGTQAMFQVGGRFWKNWNYYMRDLLIRTQVPNGHLRGSWMFEGDHSNQIGGRLYSTCMACLILEVYYRYLPVYGAASDDFRF